MPPLQATDMQLFVHLTWRTQDSRPLLGNDQLRQAAYLAVRTRTRSKLCHVLAIGGTACQIDMIVRFPASLPVTSFLRAARDAAQEALVRMQEMTSGNIQESPCYWESGYTARTLNAAQASQAEAYLQQCLTGAPSAPQLLSVGPRNLADAYIPFPAGKTARKIELAGHGHLSSSI